MCFLSDYGGSKILSDWQVQENVCLLNPRLAFGLDAGLCSWPECHGVSEEMQTDGEERQRENSTAGKPPRKLFGSQRALGGDSNPHITQIKPAYFIFSRTPL